MINLFSLPVFSFEIKCDSKFNCSKFDYWLLVASFDKNNVPYFKFIENNNKNWILTNSDIKEYFYRGDNTKAGYFSITFVKYYQYRGYNPLYTKSQNIADYKMIKRFYFYRFSGRGANIISLDNFLIAVDTYSKYIYIFGIPIKNKRIFGKDVPLQWGASDINFTKCNDFKHFYKYDPIGHVNEDGSVTLYSQYKDSFLDKEKRYLPVFSGKSVYK